MLRDRVVRAEPRVVLEAVVVAVPLMGQPSRGRSERPWNGGRRSRVERPRLGLGCTGGTAGGWAVLVGSILGRGEVVIGGGWVGFVLEHVCHRHVVDGGRAGHVGGVGAGWGVVVRRLGWVAGETRVRDERHRGGERGFAVSMGVLRVAEVDTRGPRHIQVLVVGGCFRQQ